MPADAPAERPAPIPDAGRSPSDELRERIRASLDEQADTDAAQLPLEDRLRP
jgi:hypothetical protein